MGRGLQKNCTKEQEYTQEKYDYWSRWKKIPEIPYPPRPPRMIPCPKHYCQVAYGKYNQQIGRKRQRNFYDGAGRIYFN